jgi:hypothetical protein
MSVDVMISVYHLALRHIHGISISGHGGFYEPNPVLITPKLLEEVVKVPMEEVRIIRKIGEGAFGEVSYADVESHGLVAVKWLKVSCCCNNDQKCCRGLTCSRARRRIALQISLLEGK